MTTAGTDEHRGVRLGLRPLGEVGLDLRDHGRGQHERAPTGIGLRRADEVTASVRPSRPSGGEQEFGVAHEERLDCVVAEGFDVGGHAPDGVGATLRVGEVG